MSGASSDILGGLQAAAGLGATIMGNPAVGVPLAMGGLSGLFGGGQGTGGTNPAAAATGAGAPQQGNLAGQINQIAPAAQSIMNAMGLNPQQRPQGATPQAQMPQPAPMGNRPQVNLSPQLQPPLQAAGAMPNVTAGAGSMTPASSMAPMTGGVVNPQLQQILAMLGRPY